MFHVGAKRSWREAVVRRDHLGGEKEGEEGLMGKPLLATQFTSPVSCLFVSLKGKV